MYLLTTCKNVSTHEANPAIESAFLHEKHGSTIAALHRVRNWWFCKMTFIESSNPLTINSLFVLFAVLTSTRFFNQSDSLSQTLSVVLS